MKNEPLGKDDMMVVNANTLDGVILKDINVGFVEISQLVDKGETTYCLGIRYETYDSDAPPVTLLFDSPSMMRRFAAAYLTAVDVLSGTPEEIRQRMREAQEGWGG